MLQFLLTFDGDGLVSFDQKDILNIRMTTLYIWLIAHDFKIDLTEMFGIDPGMLSIFCLYFKYIYMCTYCLFLYLTSSVYDVNSYFFPFS